MKTQYKIITLISLLLLIIINCLGQTYSPTTIYTPNHTSVTAYILTGGELSQGQKDEYLDFWLDWYDDRISCVGEATRTYNCHAWAWRISDGGSTVWLNTPGDDTFWTDDSYIEIASQSEASKISYGAACYYTHPDFGYADWCDHSAITTGTQDYFESKWGEGPRFTHDVDDCPYDDQHLHYYARPYISGTSILCSAGSSYTINDLPSECDIEWSCSANVSRVSSQGSNPCTFQANGSGDGWISATITSDVDEIDLPHFTIWVGTAYVQSISGPYTTTPYTNNYYYANANHSEGTTYDWLVSPSGPYLDPSEGENNSALVVFYSEGSYMVLARANNVCGTTSYNQKGVEVTSGFRMSVFPNPASQVITITLNEDKPLNLTESGKITEATSAGSQIYKVRIFNNQGIILSSFNRSGNIFTIPLVSISDGLYIIEVDNGNNILRQQLLVKH